jgi:hypothetical protein
MDRERVRRRIVGGLITASAVLGIWALAIAVTGGFRGSVFGITLSSREPWPVLLMAVLAAAAGVALSVWHGGWRALREDVRPLQRRLETASPSLPALAIAFVVLLGLLRHLLAASPLWLDEETLAINVRDRSFAGLAGELWLGQSAPMGWLALQRVILLTLGSSEIALRMMPLLFWIAAIGVAIWVGRRWMGLVGVTTLVWLLAWNQFVPQYALAAKQYTADVCLAFWLPALAVWAIEANDATGRRGRLLAWWIVAAVASWFAYSAALITPALGVFVVLLAWRRDGIREASVAAAFGALWVASFGVSYLVSGRYTAASEYLHTYWAAAMPPPSMSAIARVPWLFARLEPLAKNPGGTGLWIALWLTALAGWIAAAPRWIGVAFALVPLSAFALSAAGFIPLWERLAIWIVPALCVGVALLADRAVVLATSPRGDRRALAVTAAVVVVVPCLWLAADVCANGRDFIVNFDPGESTSNHALDDRAAVRWVMEQVRPGDAVLATRLTWPALYWFGRVPLSDPDVARGRGGPDVSFLEIGYRPLGVDCAPDQIRDALRGRQVALVYLGFPDAPEAYDQLVVRTLGRLGRIAAVKPFAPLSLVVVVDLTGPPERYWSRDWWPTRTETDATLDGCISVRPATRW